MRLPGTSELVPPRIIPPLDANFRPAVSFNRAFREVAEEGVPLVIGLERSEDGFARFETKVFPDMDPQAEDNLLYV